MIWLPMKKRSASDRNWPDDDVRRSCEQGLFSATSFVQFGAFGAEYRYADR